MDGDDWRWDYDHLSQDRVHEIVLEFMGAYSGVQSGIDFLIESYLKAKMPVLGPRIRRHFLKDRTGDGERVSMFHAVANEVGYLGQLVHFSPIFDRARAVRNTVGHGQVHWPVREVGVPEPYIAVISNGKKPPKVLVRPTPDTFMRLLRDCHWLDDHVMRLLYEADVVEMLNPGGEPLIPPVPPILPVDGEPLDD